jgi:hypothetical protein
LAVPCASGNNYQQPLEYAANALILGTNINFWACQKRSGIEILRSQGSWESLS